MMHLQKRLLGKAGGANSADNLRFLQELISNSVFKDTADLCFNGSVQALATPVRSLQHTFIVHTSVVMLRRIVATQGCDVLFSGLVLSQLSKSHLYYRHCSEKTM